MVSVTTLATITKFIADLSISVSLFDVSPKNVSSLQICLTRLALARRRMRAIASSGHARPFSRHAMTQSAYCQRRFAAARAMPKFQQISFQACPLARSPHDLCIFGFEPTQPVQRFFHPGDRVRRGWSQPQPLRLSADEISELGHHCGPCVEVSGNAHGWQAASSRRAASSKRALDQLDGPLLSMSASSASRCRRASRQAGGRFRARARSAVRHPR